MQNRGRVVRVLSLQCADSSLGTLQDRVFGEQGGDRSAVDRVQTRLGALQHLTETLAPGDVEPGAGGGLVDGVLQVGTAVECLRGVDADGQFEVAAQPLLVRHRLDVAEIRLRRDVQCLDDLVATRGNGVGVTGDLVQQAARAGRGVVDLVDVGAELATTGGHTALGGARTDPVRGTGGVDEELLHLGRRGRLEGGHGGGTDQDAVQRHRREAVRDGPAACQVVGSPLRRADAATYAEDQVRSGTQLGVGVEEQVVEVFPRVVTTGAAALDVGDDGERGNLVGDADHRTDLRDRARLERDVAESGLGEVLDDRDGILELRDAGGDDDAVERAPAARALGTRRLPPTWSFHR